MDRRRLTLFAGGLALLLVMAAPGWAEEAAPATSTAPADQTIQPIPLTDVLHLTEPMAKLQLKFYGWVEQSYTYNSLSPSDRINVGRVFDYRSNDYLFNQATVNLERTLKDGKDFDFGGKIELLAGSDARFIHGAGLLATNQTDTVQFDPIQFYGLVRLPVGNGLTVKFGRYVTPNGYEVIDAPGNPLYSHSFLFDWAIPFSHMGVELDYPINDKLSVYVGAVEGWNVVRDNNQSWSIMGGGTWKITDKFSATLNVMGGPEQTNNNHNSRSLVDTIFTWSVTDTLTLSLNGDYGNDTLGGPGTNWYGVAGYANLVLIPQVLNFNFRGEYFVDETGVILPIANGGTAEVFELTAGLDIHPIKSFQNLRIRPEIRWDHSLGDHAWDNIHPSRDQVTIAADLIILF